MDAGQMIMMQMPAGAGLTVAQPAPPMASATPAGDQKSGGNFAEILHGITPMPSGQPAVKVDPGKTAASEANGDATVAVQSEPGQDVPAMLLAAIGMGISPAVAAAAADELDSPSSMPQNVALSEAGAQLVQPLPEIGRMPESQQKVAKQGGDGDMAAVMNVTDAAEHIGVTSSAVTLPSHAGEEVVSVPPAAGTAVKSAVAVSHQAEAAATPIRMTSPGEKTVTRPAESPERGAANADARPQSPLNQAAVSEEGQVPLPPAAGTAVKSAVTVSHQGEAAATPVRTVTYGEKPLARPEESPERGAAKAEAQLQPAAASVGEKAPAPPAESPERGAVEGGRRVAQGSAVQRQALSGMEMADLLPRDASGRFAGSESYAPISPASTGKGPEPVRPAEFRFSSSAAVEAAVGGSQQVSGRTIEKTTAVPENGITMAAVQQLSEGMEGGFNGSGSGFDGKELEWFTQQRQEVSRTIMPQMPGAHQPFSTDTPVSAPSETLPTETSGPEGHERIAGQARDKLSGHDLKSGSDQITFKLSPDHLGDIKVNLRLDDQRLRVEIVAENRVARESLLQHVDTLKESLARQNISVEKFDVTTGGGNAGGQGNGAQGEWRELARNRQSQQWLAAGGYRTPTVEMVPSLPSYVARTEHAMVDLHF